MHRDGVDADQLVLDGRGHAVDLDGAVKAAADQQRAPEPAQNTDSSDVR